MKKVSKNWHDHPLQSLEWGEFRKKTGVKVIRESGFQVTIHKIPYTNWTIGYLPKGPLPDKQMIDELTKIGKQEHCIFIQLEPNVLINSHPERSEGSLHSSFHPLFTKYTFILDLTKSEDELLKNMHPKTRYNIKIAQKHNVTVVEDNSDEAFEEYLRLTKETTKRQGFYAHTEHYHRLMWNTLKIINHKSLIINPNVLTAHLFLATYRPETNDQRPETLAAWILFVYNDILYYPYGASSDKYREVMASNLMMWEAMRWGKAHGAKLFDLWGSLGPEANPKDPWYGFHRFKLGYNPRLVEFVGSYDLVLNPGLYNLYAFANKLRWILLKFKIA